MAIVGTKAEILQQLYQGPKSAKEICEALGLSQATFSRLVAEMTAEVRSIGKVRSTKYIALRNVGSIGSKIPIFHVDPSGKCSLFGELTAYQMYGYALTKKYGEEVAVPDIYKGIPFFLSDSRPQGFLGRTFVGRYPELKFPDRLVDWTEDNFMIAMAKRGEDSPGNLIVGRESFERYQQRLLNPVPPIPESERANKYVGMANEAMAGTVPGSSAAGEQPKFATTVNGIEGIRHVLVKFSPSTQDAVGQRWRDLLICEYLALKQLREAGLKVSEAEIIEGDGRIFLEVNRFDRKGSKGRIAVITLAALDDEWFGKRDNWVQASVRLCERKAIENSEAEVLRLLYSFGRLIANTDMHFGNISFFWQIGEEKVRLTPAYDVLPMLFAPVDGQIVPREFHPMPADPDALNEWERSLPVALKFWRDVILDERISAEFRETAKKCLGTLEKTFA